MVMKIQIFKSEHDAAKLLGHWQFYHPVDCHELIPCNSYSATIHSFTPG